MLTYRKQCSKYSITDFQKRKKGGNVGDTYEG